MAHQCAIMWGGSQPNIWKYGADIEAADTAVIGELRTHSAGMRRTMLDVMARAVAKIC